MKRGSKSQYGDLGKVLMLDVNSESLREWREIESLAGRPLAIYHPWSSPDASKDGNPPVVLRSSQGIRTIAAPESILRFEVQAGGKLLL